MRETKQTRPNGAPTPVRFSETTLNEIEEVAELLGMSRQDVIRLSTSAGLKILRDLHPSPGCPRESQQSLDTDYQHMARTTPKTVKAPKAILEAISIHRQAGGVWGDYPSDNAALVGLLRYAVVFPCYHHLTVAIAHMRPEQQDAIDDFLCRAAREGIDIGALLPKPATAEALLKLAIS